MFDIIISSLAGTFFGEAFKLAFKQLSKKLIGSSIENSAEFDEGAPKSIKYRDFIVPRLAEAVSLKIPTILEESKRRNANTKRKILPILKKILKDEIKSILKNIGEFVEEVNDGDVLRLINLYLERYATSIKNVMLLIDDDLIKREISNALSSRANVLFEEFDREDANSSDEIEKILKRVLSGDIKKIKSQIVKKYKDIKLLEIQVVIATVIYQVSFVLANKSFFECRKFILSEISHLAVKNVTIILNRFRQSGYSPIMSEEEISEIPDILYDLLEKDIKSIELKAKKKFENMEVDEITLLSKFVLVQIGYIISKAESLEYKKYIEFKISCIVNEKLDIVIEQIQQSKEKTYDEISKILLDNFEDEFEEMAQEIERLFTNVNTDDVDFEVGISLYRIIMLLFAGENSTTLSSLQKSLDKWVEKQNG